MRIFSEEELWDEEIERRAREYFETARAEGSLMGDTDLLAEARTLAERDLQRVHQLADAETEPDEEP
ncbi:MAG: hypothetical protein M3R13_00120 [Armatimonadota bacterium]|nr:hypothetical protein [Armatimonadota bacterium]